MKKILMIGLLGLLMVNMHCGGGGTSSDISPKTALTINLGEVRDASSLSASERGLVSTSSIPPHVVSIRITISAPDMPTIVETVPTAGLSAVTVTIEVPNGPNRHIVVEALNDSGGVLYRGEEYVDLDGTPVSVPITMVSADPFPPVFAGLSSITDITQTTMVLSWSAATDNVTPQYKIQYLIYMTLSSEEFNFTSPSFTTSLGATSYTVTGLSPDTAYKYIVRAMDEIGNVDSNMAQMEARTLQTPDTNPPTFGGLTSATAIAPTEVQLLWSEATDDRTPTEDIVYLIYMATTPGGQNFTTPTAMTAPGATTYTVTGLSPETMYCFVVRAKDEAGNIDANTVEQCATTPPVAGPLSISPVSATVVALTNPDGSPADDVTFTISGGTPPYNVTSDNTSLIASPGAIPGSIFTVDPDITSATCSGGLVTLTVTDSGSPPHTTTATVDVQRPPVLFSPAGGQICENDNTCSAGTETLPLALQGVAPLNIVSSNPTVIPSPGSISTYTYTIDAIDNSIGVTTDVTLTLTDSCGGGPLNALITVINQDLYVNVNTGDDVTGTGSFSDPFKTITKALSVTPGGETIHVAAGTHDIAAGETFPLQLKTGTTLDCTAWPGGTLISHTGTDIVTVNGAPNASLLNCGVLADCAGGCAAVVIDASDTGMLIDNCLLDGNISSGVGVYIANGNTTIQNSDISDFGDEGVIIYTGSAFPIPTITNTSISYNDYGITVYSPSNISMSNCSVYCNTTNDLLIDSTVTVSYTVNVSNNAWDNDPPDVGTYPPCFADTDICYDVSFITMIDSPNNPAVPGGCPISP